MDREEFLSRFVESVRNVLLVSRHGGVTGAYRSPFEEVTVSTTYRLRHYRSAARYKVPLLLVPPLMVTAEVYDISETQSAVRALGEAGVDVWLVDFGAPEAEEGGLERTLSDHVRAVSAAIEAVQARTGRKPVLAGYSQGGMFCYQVAAFRDGSGIDSIITFGSPVDMHKRVPVRSETALGVTSAMQRWLRSPLERIEGVPGALTSVGFKAMNLRKEMVQIAEFFSLLHDREALARRESRRRFLSGEGFVAWPGPAFRAFVDEFVVHNRMMSGGFVVDGQVLSLSAVSVPILYFVGLEDELAKPEMVRAIREAAPLAECSEKVVASGHFGLVVGSRAMAETWPEVVRWVRARDAASAPMEPQTKRESISPRRSKPSMPPPPESTWPPEAKLLLRGLTRAKSVFREARDNARSLQYQLPRLAFLERQQPDTIVNLAALVAERASKDPDAVFFLWGGRAFSLGQVEKRIDAVARAFWLVGIRSHMKVAVAMHDRPSLLSAIAALNRLGAVAVVLKPTDSVDFWLQAMQELAVDEVVCDPEFALALTPRLERDCFVLGGGSERELPIGAVDVERIDEAIALRPLAEWNQGKASDLMMLLVSDRAGAIRTVRVSNGRWAMSAWGVAASCALTAEDTIYSGLPLHHPAGLLMTVGGALVSGARFAFAHSEGRFWQEIARYGVSVVFYAGEQMRRRLWDEDVPVVTSIRAFAGSGLRPAVYDDLLERFPTASIVEYYAGSETPVVLMNAKRKRDSLGKPLPGVGAVALVRFDDASGELCRRSDGRLDFCATGEAGVLCSRLDERGPQDEEQTVQEFASVRTSTRWRRSSDVLRRDDDGDFSWVGSLRESVVVDGKRRFFRVEETALERLFGVEFAVFFPVGSELWCAIELQDNVAREEIERHAHADRILWCGPLEIPLSDSFAIDRALLASWAQTYEASP